MPHSRRLRFAGVLAVAVLIAFALVIPAQALQVGDKAPDFELPGSQGKNVKLSELTNRMPIGRLYCTNDTVWASVPVFGRDFQATHLMLAVQVMTGLADELDDRLHGEFGGARFFGEGDKPAVKGREPNGKDDKSERTGMYL